LSALVWLHEAASPTEPYRQSHEWAGIARDQDTQNTYRVSIHWDRSHASQSSGHVDAWSGAGGWSTIWHMLASEITAKPTRQHAEKWVRLAQGVCG